MKIEIITRHAISNYGSLLQAYATEKIFQSMGYKTEIINYIPKSETKIKQCETFASFSNVFGKNVITKFIYKLLQKNNMYKMYDAFYSYRRSLLNLTKEYNDIDELKKDYPKADIYCTGSDQVWGKIGEKEYDEAYFLSFLSKNTKCISFSSSFGTAKVSKQLYNNLPKLLGNYKFLLVREKTAVDILNSLGFKNIKLFLDPTLLLNKETWKKLCIKEKIKEDYILVYQLHHNKNFDKYVKKLSKLKKIKVIRISVSKYYKYKFGNFVYLPSIEEFLTYIKNAKYVITDSFHGTVFSIIFNIPFIDILPSKTGTRIKSLLEMLNITDRIVENFNDINIIDKTVDFNKINRIINSARLDNLKYLKTQINLIER